MAPGEVLNFPGHPRIRPKAKASPKRNGKAQEKPKGKPRGKGKGGLSAHVSAAQRRKNDRERDARRRLKKAESHVSEGTQNGDGADPVSRPDAHVSPTSDRPSIGARVLVWLATFGAAAGNFVVEWGTLSGMFGGDLVGGILAGSLGLVEIGTGVATSFVKERDEKRLATFVLIGLGAIEACMPLIREVQVHQKAVHDALHDTVQVEQCPVETAPAVQPPPADVAADPVQRRAWNAQQRLLHKQDLEAIAHRANACAARQRAERNAGQGKLESAAEEHSVVETPVRMGLGFFLTLGIGFMARALGRKAGAP
jgi:hypothetical protein